MEGICNVFRTRLVPIAGNFRLEDYRYVLINQSVLVPIKHIDKITSQVELQTDCGNLTGVQYRMFRTLEDARAI